MAGAGGRLLQRLVEGLRWRLAKALKGTPLHPPLSAAARAVRDLRHRAIARRPANRRHDAAQRAALADWIDRQGRK